MILISKFYLLLKQTIKCSSWATPKRYKSEIAKNHLSWTKIPNKYSNSKVGNNHVLNDKDKLSSTQQDITHDIENQRLCNMDAQ